MPEGAAFKYAVISTLVRDEITLANGSFAGEHLGGAGLYALCGAYLWSSRTLLVTGIGSDLLPMHGAWFRKNSISTDGLFVREGPSAVSMVQYAPDGERVETPRYGFSHYASLEAVPGDLEKHAAALQGVYIFKDFGPKGYWDRMLALKQRHGFCLMWELNANVANSASAPRVREIARAVDVLSLNLTEAKSLVGAANAKDAAEALMEWGLPLVFLRMGAAGAMVLANGAAQTVPAIPFGPVVDVTGGGNASSAAVLVGFCEGRPAAECAAMGNISAGLCLGQYGPPNFTPEVLQKAQQLLNEWKGRNET